MSKSFEQLKKQLNQFKEEKEMQDIIANLDARKAAIKESLGKLKKLVNNHLVDLIVLKKKICIIVKRTLVDISKVHLIWMHLKHLS
jgi:esterase/lipase